MNKLLTTFALLAAVLALPAPGFAAPPTAAAVPAPAAATRVQVVTSAGNFTIELNAERSPLTVAAFLKYVDSGQYTQTIIHRAIANFVIQGGGYDTNYKLKPTASKTFNESGNGLNNVRGTVGLARGPEPHSGDCQFYVNLADNSPLDPNPARWGYAVFGKVVDGMDVVDRISTQPTGAAGPLKEDSPLTEVVIQRIERVTAP
jgi:cyclophilin family peptidyl-prolyl cis-trans isomerase